MLRLPEFVYHRPASLEEALALLREHAGDVLPIAGGTDAMPNMKHRLLTPAHVVGIKGLPELRGIAVGDGALSIGAAETLATVARHPLVVEHAPSLAKAAGLVAGPQLRNMGTIGGNLCLDTRCTYYNQTHFWRKALGFCLKKDGDTCHVTKVGRKCVAAHSADTPPVLMTLGAVAELASADGAREVPVAEFFVADGVWNSVRRPDEIVVRIRVPLPPPGLRTAFHKLRQRNSIDFPLLNVAAAAGLDGDVVRELRIVVSALGARPRMLSGLDRLAAGERLTDDVIEAVAERAFQQCHPLDNIIVDPNWRRAMVPVYVRRALNDLRAGVPAAA
ncbi:MAG TPA: FAD binding domain-containing protein [Longimicrobiales bacterium]